MYYKIIINQAESHKMDVGTENGGRFCTVSGEGARIAFLSGLLRMSGMYDDGWLLDGFSRCVRSNVL